MRPPPVAAVAARRAATQQLPLPDPRPWSSRRARTTSGRFGADNHGKYRLLKIRTYGVLAQPIRRFAEAPRYIDWGTNPG